MPTDGVPGAFGGDIVDFGLGASSGLPPAAPRTPKRRWRAGRIVFWASFAVITACLIASVVGLRDSVRIFTDNSDSMGNTLQRGDWLLVDPRSDVHRGDIVIVSDPQGPRVNPGNYVERLIGLPGDHVACCDAAGDVTVNGKELHEQEYLYPGDSPSRIRFSVTLGKGQVWVMGDHRSISRDSREWGSVPEANIVGWVFETRRGSSDLSLTTPSTFIEDGLASPRSQAAPAAFSLSLTGLVLAPLALLALGVLGVTRWAIRKRRVNRMRREDAYLGQPS